MPAAARQACSALVGQHGRLRQRIDRALAPAGPSASWLEAFKALHESIRRQSAVEVGRLDLGEAGSKKAALTTLRSDNAGMRRRLADRVAEVKALGERLVQARAQSDYF